MSLISKKNQDLVSLLILPNLKKIGAFKLKKCYHQLRCLVNNK